MGFNVKWILIGSAMCVAFAGVAAAQTFLGNCGSGIIGIQFSTGNVYCYPSPTLCSNSMDFSQSCNTQYGF